MGAKSRIRMGPLNGDSRLPWFPTYPGDLEGDPEYRVASLAERGALHSAWNNQWLSPHDCVPADPVRFARLLGITTDEAEDVLPFVRRYFDEYGGNMADPRLSAMRTEAHEITNKRRAAAEARWAKVPE